MKDLKCLFAFLLFTIISSCSYHMYNKKEAIAEAKTLQNRKNEHIIIEDDDRVLKVLTRDSNLHKLDVIYHFDNKNKQLKYTLTTTCDSCFQKYLLKELKNNAFKWHKLNDSTYISRYSLKRFLNIHQYNFSYEVVEHNLSKTECEDLILSSKNKKSF